MGGMVMAFFTTGPLFAGIFEVFFEGRAQDNPPWLNGLLFLCLYSVISLYTIEVSSDLGAERRKHLQGLRNRYLHYSVLVALPALVGVALLAIDFVRSP